MFRGMLLLAAMALAPCLCAAADAEVPAKPITEAKWLHTEADAVGWAFDALAKYRDEDRRYVRFVYLPPWASKEWVGVVDLAVNLACSHTTTLIRGDRHAGGWLLGYRLNQFAPDPHKLAELVRIWDKLAIHESRFHVPAINIEEIVENGQRRKVDRRTALLAPHLVAALAKRASGKGEAARIDVLVTQLTKSTGGIYPADFLIEQLLTSRRGYYPEFRQMHGANGRFVPLGDFLRSRGFYFEQSSQLRGDKGALILASDVTGKSRVIVTVFGLASSTPMAVTFDFADEKIRPDQQFIRNVLDFQPQSDASEIFVPMQNGLVEFVLADSKGNIQRAAPANVVADWTKPNGHTKELEMGMSCLMCHMPANGYQTARNDMEVLLGSDIDYIGEDFSLGGKKLTKDEAVAVVVGRFGQRIDEPDGILGRARRDFVKAIDALTDYPVTADGPSAAQLAGQHLKEIYHPYRYGLIDADRACLELGLQVPKGTGKTWLRTIAPAPAAGQEDVVIGLLRNGAAIKRDDFDAIYVELARRALAYREAEQSKE